MTTELDKPKSLKVLTPRGKLRWPKLTEPDYGTDQFPIAGGAFNTNLLLDTGEAAVEKFISDIDKKMAEVQEWAQSQFEAMPVKNRKKLEAAGGISADDPYSEEYDAETEEPTGEVSLKCKRNYSGENKKTGKRWTASVNLIDAKKKPLPKNVEIWSGTTARIGLELAPYFIPASGKYGLSRRMEVVQIVELVAGGSRVNDYGFEEEEGGFDASNYEAPEREREDDQVSGADEDADDDPSAF